MASSSRTTKGRDSEAYGAVLTSSISKTPRFGLPSSSLPYALGTDRCHMLNDRICPPGRARCRASRFRVPHIFGPGHTCALAIQRPDWDRSVNSLSSSTPEAASLLSFAERGRCPPSPMPGGPFLYPRDTLPPRLLASPLTRGSAQSNLRSHITRWMAIVR